MPSKKCGKCKNFQSYRSVYEDDEEDEESGICNLTGEHKNVKNKCKTYMSNN